MASYTDYVTDFRDAASKTSMFEFKSGLCYVFRNTFAAIPGSIGHFFDTVIGLDGLFTSDEKNHFGGPFGVLLGIVPFIVGANIGMALQVVLNLPAYAAYYIIDKPLSLLIENFDKIMQGQLKRFHFLNMICDIVNRFYVRATQGTPTQMNGLFGFLVGVLPQTTTFFLIRIGATISSVSRFVTDKICEGIHALYSKIGGALQQDRRKNCRKKRNS